MSRVDSEARLAIRNSLRARGRTLILAVVLGAGCLAASLSTLLVSEVARAVAEGVPQHQLPLDLVSRGVVPFRVNHLTDDIYYGILVPYKVRRTGNVMVGRMLSMVTPSGPLTVVALSAGTANRELHWYAEYWGESLQGRWPEQGEVAIPRPVAESLGVGIGDDLELQSAEGDGLVTFRVSGVYVPVARGELSRCLLTRERGQQPLNFFIGITDRSKLARAEADGLITILDFDLRSGLTNLVRDVYGSHVKAVRVGLALVGAAVLMVLLVAWFERRREFAVCKSIGMSGQAVMRVLGMEMGVALGLALLISIPAFYWASARLLNLADSGPLVSALVKSLGQMTMFVMLGVAYPFALATVATPAQLLRRQSIPLIRQRVPLERWSRD